MKNQISRIFITLLLAGFFPPFIHAEKVEPAFHNPISAKSSGSSEKFLDEDGPVYTITLPSIEVNILPSDKGPQQTGITYQLPEPVTNSQLNWKAMMGGYVTRIQLSADQAKRLRFHLHFVNPQSHDIHLRVQGNLDPAPLPINPVDESGIYPSELWLPITKGDSAELEVFIRSSNNPDSPIFVLDAINYIVADTANLSSRVAPNGLKKTGNKVYSLREPGNKEFNLSCWVNDPNYNGLKIAAAGTAVINYIASDNKSYSCTGTLLNDAITSYKPWFATAHHCLPDQATADTATFEWFRQTLGCDINYLIDLSDQTTYGGAQLLWTDYNLDIAFLRLYQAPPDGVAYIGWSTEINVGDAIWGVHHPHGEPTVVCKGTVTGLLQHIDGYMLDTVSFSVGGTEGGSSGSGLFSIANNGNTYWKGTLWGGPISNYQISYYSHFDSYYNNIKGWLRNTAPEPLPVARISCFLDRMGYSGLINKNFQNYIYRYNPETNYYLGVSYTDNQSYFMDGARGEITGRGALLPYLNYIHC